MPIVIVILGAVVLVAAAAMYAVMVGAFVLAVMWGWFITPLYGIPVPPFPLAAGLLAVVRYVAMATPTRYKDHEEDSLQTTFAVLLGPWVILGCAWFIHVWAGNTLGIWGA